MPDHGRNRSSRLSRCSRRGVRGPAFIGLMAFGASLAPAMADDVAVAPSVVAAPSTQVASVNSSLLPPSAPLVQSSQQGIDVLIQQAKFWRDRSRTDLAEQMLNRVLAVNPREPQAIYAMGQMAAEDGRRSEARQWLARLATASPTDPRIDSLQKAISGGEVSPEVVDQARRLVSSGQYDAAVARYRQAFGGSTPPAQYALEYYQTLAGTDTDWDGAHQGLAKLAQARPGDPRVQFAYAQVLTFRESTRRDGISILSKLAPTMGEAKTAWRQALIWLNASEADKPLFTAYLSQYPDDRDLEAKQLASETIEPVDQVAALVGQGFVSLNNARLDDAAASFQRALALDPKSAPALGGFGVVNLRAGRFADATGYLQKAIDADPAEKGRWETALAASNFYGTMDDAVTARDKGDLVKAEQLARQLANGDDPDRGDAQLLLADVLRKQGKYAQAEDLYARLAQANPGEQKLAAALADVRAKQGKPVVATASVPASPQPVEATAGRPSPSALIDEAKQARDDGRPTDALALINRIPPAQKTADVAALTGTLNAERAIAQARVAYVAGQKGQAVAMLGQLAATPGTNAETRSNVARAFYDMGEQDQAEQLVRNELGRVSSGRPADYRGFIAVAALSGDEAASDQLLRNIAASASSSPDDQAEIGKLRATVTGAKADRLRLAGNFTGAWDTLAGGFRLAPGAPELLGPLARLYQTGHLPLQALQIYDVMLQKDPGNVALMGEAISASIDAGALPRAQAMLQQAMRKDPRNPRLYLLASRIAQASGNRSDALNVLDTARALQREQAGIADADGSYRTASLGPVSAGSPDVPAEPSTVARNSAPGNSGHDGEIKVADSLSGPPVYLPSSPSIPGVYTNQSAPVEGTVSTPSTVVVRPASVPVYAPGATMQRVTLPGFQPAQSSVPTYGAPGYAATDSLSQQIDQEIASVEQQVAPRIDASVAYNGHNGTTGLSKMQDVTGTVAFTFSPFNTGRLTVAAMPEHIKSGTPTGSRLAAFGYNPSLFGNSFAAGKQSDSGVGLGAAYSIGKVTADIGTTPVGFAHTNMVGGVEWTPRLADNVTLRAKLERRAVMETVLSYAGTRDNYSGRKWGAVTKTGGSLGLSYDDGKTGAYVDGSYYEYRGLNVAHNSAIGANVGAYIRPILAEDRMLQVGVNVNYANFKKNLGQFSFGHGGYFSPQQYVAFALPIEYDGKVDRWSYRLQGAPGYQITRQSSAPYFPTDDVAQTNLNYAAMGSGGSIQSYYASSNDKGFGFSGLGQVEYELTKQTTLGATAGYNSFGNYHETKAMIYLKQMLGE
ncbi:MAG: cellulose synthase subunit BcsC-related outer membrane protein [Parvibaculaceae bacterium]|nr:cellulose synthase subunit BcsC-related outer membrane protein [Parvibaculaceae bacterium]